MDRRTYAPTLAAIAVLAVATGCSGSTSQQAKAPVKPAGGSSGSGSQPSTRPSTPAPPPNLNVTQQQADGILTAYQTANNKMNQARDTKTLADIETGSAYTIDDTVFKALAVEDPHGKQKYTPVFFTKRAYVIPKLTAYPLWFLSRSQINVSATKETTTDMVFVQTAPGAPWKVSYEPDALMGNWNDANAAPPAVPTPAAAADASGAATTLTPADADSLAADPGQLAHLIGLAQSVGQPGAADAGQQFRTFGMLDIERQGLANDLKHGQVGQEVPTMPPTLPTYPVYAYRTTDGGALVYVTTVNRWQYNVQSNTTITLKDDLAALYGSTTAHKSINVDYLEQFLVYVPAKGKGKLDVLQGKTYVESVANQ